MNKTQFLEWLDRHNCHRLDVREYVVDFYSNTLDDAIKHNTTISYNLRLDIYHVTDRFTGEDLYSGNFTDLKKLLGLSEINQISAVKDEKLDTSKFDDIVYSYKSMQYYGF